MIIWLVNKNAVQASSSVIHTAQQTLISYRTLFVVTHNIQYQETNL